jgi:hypothetical protein
MAAEPFTQLKRLATQKLVKGETAISTAIVVDDRSPLYRRLGQPVAERMVARSLAGMLLAPQHSPANPSFLTVVRNLDQGGFAFTALATTSTSAAGEGEAAGSVPRGAASGVVSAEQALARIKDLTDQVLNGATMSTVAQGERDGAAPYLNFIVPISRRSPEFAKLRELISTWLPEERSIYLYSVVAGDGSVVGDTQVGMLYGITDEQLPQQAVPARASNAQGSEH